MLEAAWNCSTFATKATIDFEDALSFVLTQRRITPGGLQRRLVTGYTTCESWLARMEAEGIVSGADEDGSRAVLARTH